MPDTFPQFEAKLAGLERDVNDRKTMNRLGVGAKADALEAAKNDWGGDAQIGTWHHGALATTYEIEDATDAVEIMATKRTRGPWLVADQGRHKGEGAGPWQGPIAVRLTKSGKASKRQQKRKKWNGQTEGRDTWADAVALMEKRTVGRYYIELQKALAKRFTGS